MCPLTAAVVIGSGGLADEVQACLRDLPVHVILRQPEIADTVLFADQVNRLQVDVLFLGVAQAQSSFEEIAGCVRSTDAPPLIVAIDESSEPERILGAIRAGAADYIYPPVAEKMRKTVNRCAKLRGVQRPAARPSGRILAFTSSKGGCGATTIVCHAAAALQRNTEQKILLADLDLESGLIGFLMKVKSQYSMLDAARNIERLDPSYWEALVTSACPRLDVVSAPAPPCEMEVRDPADLRDVLRFLRAEYAWILLDLGRGLGRLAATLLDEVDSLCLVATPEVPALYQAGRLAGKLREMGYGNHKIRLILNRVAKSADAQLQLAERMSGLTAYGTVPNGYLEFYETYQQGKLLTRHGDLSKALEALAGKFMAVGDAPEIHTSPAGQPQMLWA